MIIEIETISYLVGTGFGIISTAIYFKLKTIEQKLKNVEDSFPTPEEVAKEVIKVKLPLSEVPPDVMENIKGMAEKLKDKKIIESYVG